jgi:hypothetical protein
VRNRFVSGVKGPRDYKNEQNGKVCGDAETQIQ